MFNQLIDQRFRYNNKAYSSSVYTYRIGTSTVYSGRKVASSYLESIKETKLNSSFNSIFLIREPNDRFISGFVTCIYHLRPFFKKNKFTFDENKEGSISEFVRNTASMYPEVYLSDPHLQHYHTFLYDKVLMETNKPYKILDINNDSLNVFFNNDSLINSSHKHIKEQVHQGLKSITDSRALTSFNLLISLEKYYYKKLFKLR